jgi:small subunit ribosomal protein S1
VRFVRQILQLDEPIQVKIYEWNTGGLLTRIEARKSLFPTPSTIDVSYGHQLCYFDFCSRLRFRPTSFQGLRAFLPKFELVDRISSFTDLKNKVRSFWM